jgi:hypothetical protein
MMMFRGPDGLLREYEIISTRDRVTFFQKACPVLPVPLAIICCFLNIIPGKQNKLLTAFLPFDSRIVFWAPKTGCSLNILF